MDIHSQLVTKDFAIYNSDCMNVLPEIPDNSVHMAIYSLPFFSKKGSGGLYHYSSSERDLSNCLDYDDFFKHYEFIVKELSRIIMPGRVCAVHCMDIPEQGANIGAYTDFPGDIIRAHQKYGFDYLPRISIWKEPLGVRNRTMAKSLYHKQICEDSTLTCVAAGDYLLPLRKKGTNPVPVSHPIGLTHYAGDTAIPNELLKYRKWDGNQIENRYSHWIWRQYASSQWWDIRIGNPNDIESIPETHRKLAILPFKESKEEEDEKHVHPLQLDVIERACVLWTNPGEIVVTPFMGVGSEVFGAVLNGRYGLGIELKTSYYNQAKKNIPMALEKQQEQMDLF